MQEDIHRRIQVHNSSSQLFQIFLLYLYSGRLSSSQLSSAQLIELLILADCYEVQALKNSCEVGLIPHLVEETVLEWLHMADQLQAVVLRVSQL